MELEVDEDVEATPSLEDGDASPEDSGGDDGKDEKQDDKGGTVSREEFLELKKSFEATQKERDELRESERYWSERARAGKTEAKPEPEEEEDDLADLLADIKDDDGDNDKFIDELTGEGAAALKKRGFVTKKEALELAREVAERVAAKASRKAVGVAEKKLQRGNELLRTFPFIDKEDSEGFQLTSEYFRAAVKRNPAKAEDPEALWNAAEKAKLVLDERAKAAKSRGGNKEARMRAQADARGGSVMDGDDDEMSDMERGWARKLGVTEKEFKAHRVVNIAGVR